MTSLINPSGDENWKQLLHLGEQLLNLDSLTSQKKAILSTSKHIFECQADIWINERLNGEDTKDLQFDPAVLRETLSPLMISALEQKKLVIGEQEDFALPKRRKTRQPLTPIMNGQGNFAAVPLVSKQQLLGVIQLGRPGGPIFNPMEINLLDGLAIQSAMALQATRQITSDKRKAEHLAMVTEVTNAISSILELEKLLEEVVLLVHERLGYPLARVYSVHTGRRKIFLQAGYSAAGWLDTDEIFYDLDNDSGIISQVSREGIPKIIHKNTEGELVVTLANPTSKTQAILVLPLKFGQSILGVLEIQSGKYPQAFSKDEQILLEALADYIAIAIRNANLYRSETWRRQVADSMREVAGLLTADAALDQVLNIILHELERTLPCDVVSIWLTDETQSEGVSSQLRLAAVHITQNFQTTNASNENHLTPDEILHLLGQSTVPSPWLLDGIQATEPQTRHSDDPYEPLGAILDFPADYSAIAAPMKVAGQPLGLLVLAHHTSGRYGQESKSMTETFASYAAVAIENTRLYEAAHDQAWVSTVLLQVAEATQSLNTLDELLATMVRITPMLIGVNSCSIFLWDNTTDVFTPAATYGIKEELVDEFLTWRVRLGENSAFDQIVFNKNLVFIEEDSSPHLIFGLFTTQYTRLVLFPMIAHGEVLGAFLVDYNQETKQSRSGRLSEEVDWEEKFTIIQGIAHQTAFAVENIRLVKAQQDEAYVSVALLQVAQAVVSLNALDEILEAIVRITPILVGVRRSMIFLWDASMKVFRLSQWYGVNRSELSMVGDEFTSDAFPMLEAVRVSNSIIYHKCSEDTDSPVEWNTIRSPSFNIIEQDFHNGFGRDQMPAGEDAYLGRDYLKSQESLLLGFPLSVKGTVLGVMLTQEMEMTSGIPTRHIREKRLEISIGITQQAAMAIQNDLLQREVVERERLEREFQLARDIQKTFLPNTLPVFEGWDLFSLWQPARQVSGDFFDIIELPNHRWGLLIADVADKGMPAALYMTLIRTLIRAAVNNDDSPASVLSRVNNLLVADSKSGMFVTIIYAVVSLKDGTLSYANAGHNPPLLLRKNGQLRKLHGTGMALGIFENIEIQEKNILLQPGDYLVCYTDGITEAFSPQDVMFGEERLIEAIIQTVPCQAQNLAETITRQVYEFMQDSTPSDDITMVVLRRN